MKSIRAVFYPSIFFFSVILLTAVSYGSAPAVIFAIPSQGTISVVKNSQVILEFSRAMDTPAAESAFISSPVITGTFSWSKGNTVLTLSPTTQLETNTLYTLSVSTGAKDSTGIPVAAQYGWQFTTGSSLDANPPSVSFDHFSNDITTEALPVIKGTVSDALSCVVDVECRIDGDSWQETAPDDGYFNSSSESFSFSDATLLSIGTHTIEARSTNSCGFSTINPDRYTFIYIPAAPTFTVMSSGTEIKNNDPLPSAPLLGISVLTAAALDTASVKLSIDGNLISGPAVAKNSDTGYSVSYQVPASTPLADGTHSLKIEATTVTGHTGTKEVTGLSVNSSASATLTGTPLNYPNPFDPSGGTSISYYLTKNADIHINIYDISGNCIAKKLCSSGTAGGSAGYNEVLWDAKSGSGMLAGNGIYVYFVIADGKLIGKGKMTAFRK